MSVFTSNKEPDLLELFTFKVEPNKSLIKLRLMSVEHILQIMLRFSRKPYFKQSFKTMYETENLL